jgi:AraC family transcriptional regulator of adaptative response/methylated-DNA-[protein]-cysteine methyltransferase
MTPRARRDGGKGETIRFTVVSTWLGWALIAATERGVCMTGLGDDRMVLESDLRRRFPAATLVPADGTLTGWAERVVRYITRPAEQLDLPLDIRGTAFQAQVWRALQKIPPGQTTTYTEIAAALGRPRAVRAVAQACAGNKLAVLIPCHRVVRTDGELAGYRWGVERKRALIAREHEDVAAEAAAE